MTELKPCPFCGREKIHIMVRFPLHNEMVGYYSVCAYCGARSAIQCEEQWSIEAWNRRYTPHSEIDFDYGAED